MWTARSLRSRSSFLGAPRCCHVTLLMLELNRRTCNSSVSNTLRSSSEHIYCYERRSIQKERAYIDSFFLIMRQSDSQRVIPNRGLARAEDSAIDPSNCSEYFSALKFGRCCSKTRRGNSLRSRTCSRLRCRPQFLSRARPGLLQPGRCLHVCRLAACLVWLSEDIVVALYGV